MYLLGHIGLTAFLSKLLYLPALFAIVGVLLPDIVDKGLFVLGISPCGRFLGHTIFFAPVLGIITYLITRRKGFAIAIAFGAFFHLAEDSAYFLPLLYPVKTYPFSLICGIMKVRFGYFQIISELIGAILLVFTFGYGKTFLRFRNWLWPKIFKRNIKKVIYEKNR